MRLKKIKLSGFKSFVDPTTILIPSNLVGVVGPNGCGKSNVIDAVRWVMGESSAKHLRGDSMADVIFNGSSSRKPVGHAGIELVFDNQDGTCGGQYAAYGEIAIKRQVSRDGTSSYWLNGTRCRRRDITDIFLGTGLGPRSYSIIEQGMISRLIEAKPEDLRTFLEEAAGISKYKERRKETENRIRHTRENLDRLSDLREEVEKQLNHLQRQAKTAEKYKDLKQEERQLRGELLALRLRNLARDAEGRERHIRERETALEAAVATQRAVEAALEKDREVHTEASDAFNAVQGRYYGVGGEIARLEQSIHHAKEMRQRQQTDLDQTERGWRELQEHLDTDRAQLADVERQLAESLPALERTRAQEEASHEARAAAEEHMHAWQREWDEFNQRAAGHSEAAQVERTRIDHLERQLVQLEGRIERLRAEQQGLDSAELEREIARLAEEEAQHAARAEQGQDRLHGTMEEIRAGRERIRSLSEELEQQRGALQDGRGRLASLKTLQQAALGQTDAAVGQWLESTGLLDAPRLAQELEVQDGWERALETVLGPHLEAVCVPGMDVLGASLGDLEHGAMAVFDTGARVRAEPGAVDAQPLASQVRAPWSLDGVLGGVYGVDSLGEALALRPRLAAHESVVTRDGIWLGASWLRVVRNADEHAGVLAREHEIKTLSVELDDLDALVRTAHARLEDAQEQLAELEQRRESLQHEVNEAHRRHGELRSQVSSRRSRLEQMQSRAQALRGELEELLQQQTHNDAEVQEARTRLNASLEEMERLAGQREDLAERRDRLRAALDEARNRARADRDQAHAIALKLESMRSQQQSLQQSSQRMESQLQDLTQRRAQLQESLELGVQPITEQEAKLAGLLGDRVKVENELADARRRVEDCDESMRRHEQQRSGAEHTVSEVRTELEQARVGFQEVRVRRQTLEEQLGETGLDRAQLLEALAEDAGESEWVDKVEQVAARIQRLGPINLDAIEEFAEQQERKTYLDAQYKDVTDALETLENAIRKIDRETRTRFKETFDKVNTGLQALFPRLFGGGHAYLELTGEDLLDTGVSVMARPPGKRNSSIHLLSGGEKALTAVALVFSIFQLNPAPFCMLDEVDAPLDDANVARFCDMVREMAEHVQFVFITHNKITMSLANQLTGVTMHEPGVSRLVAVDVDEAARLAAV